MAVIHYIKDGNILCGTKAKKFITTENKSEITCKRCLKKYNSTSLTNIKVEKTRDYLILTYKRISMHMKQGDVSNFMFCSPEGSCFTSIKLCGTQIKRNMPSTDRNHMIKVFQSLKNENGILNTESIYNYFKDNI